MPLPGVYGPSSIGWVREEVEHYDRTGAAWDDRPVVVLSTLGARSGLVRRTPLMRVEHGGCYAVVASSAGAATHPSWYANALAHSAVSLQDGAVDLDLVARELDGDERARWWSRACTVFPSYATYQSRTRRRIPVLLLQGATHGRVAT